MNHRWKKAELSEVCEISSTLVDPRKSNFVNLLHVGAGNMVSGTGELIDIQTAQEEGLKSGKFLFDRTMVLYSKIRPYLMKVARPEFDGLCSADVYPLLPKVTKLDRDFLFYLLMSKEFTEYAIQGSNRAGMPKVNRDHLFRFATYFPPIEEQKRIVAIVDQAFEAIDVAIENTKQNLANARELFESYLNDVFDREESDWGNVTLETLAERITKGSSPKWQGVNYVDKPGVLFVTSENVGQNQMLFEKTKYVEEIFNEIDSKSILAHGDVLTNIVGASIGRTAIYDREELANINQAVCLIRCRADKLLNHYLAYLLNSPYFLKILHENEVDNARANLSLGFFRGLKIPLPPLDEQQSIVSKMDDFSTETQRLEAIYRQKLAALTELKQSILQKAFTGELTADQEAP
jgi:type I restriction enzyme, S subunit